MTKLVYLAVKSLDGYIVGPGGAAPHHVSVATIRRDTLMDADTQVIAGLPVRDLSAPRSRL